MTSLPANAVTRKSLGAWYTPPSLVQPLVRWAVRSSSDHVLDPAVGDGVFLVEAARLLQQYREDRHGAKLHGVDRNPDAVMASREAVARVLTESDPPDLRVADFFLLEPPTDLFGGSQHVDAVIGNPPYVRYQSFGKQGRTAALRQAERVGVRLTSLSSSWAPFVVHAVSFLRRGGRLALVLPEEIVHAAYASEVRRYLRKTFRLTTVVRFEDHAFPEAQERVVFLLAEGKDLAPVGELRLASVRKPEDVGDLRGLVERGESFPPPLEPQKWEIHFHDPAASILDGLVGSGHMVPLRAVGKANIGYVSGANDFFVFSPSEVRERRFPLKLMRPTVIAARQVRGTEFTEGDFARLVESDEPCFLWTGKGADLPQVAAFIEGGRARGISRRYKCRVREPWYVVPGVVEPDALLTYMSGDIPRLVLNRIRVTCSNNLLVVRLDGIEKSLHQAFVGTFYNSATMLSAERIGRRYGGGVLKLEPSEADRLLVPSVLALNRMLGANALFGKVDSYLRTGRIGQALSDVDEAFLLGVCRLGREDVRELIGSHVSRQESRRRKPTKASSRAAGLQ